MANAKVLNPGVKSVYESSITPQLLLQFPWLCYLLQLYRKQFCAHSSESIGMLCYSSLLSITISSRSTSTVVICFVEIMQYQPVIMLPLV